MIVKMLELNALVESECHHLKFLQFLQRYNQEFSYLNLLIIENLVVKMTIGIMPEAVTVMQLFP